MVHGGDGPPRGRAGQGLSEPPDLRGIVGPVGIERHDLDFADPGGIPLSGHVQCNGLPVPVVTGHVVVSEHRQKSRVTVEYPGEGVKDHLLDL